MKSASSTPQSYARARVPGHKQVERTIRAMSRVVMISKPKKALTIGMLCAAAFAVSACQGLTTTSSNNASSPVASQSASAQLAAVQEVFDANAEQVPTLTAVGYAVVSSQPGRSDSQKRLMAIRSARMAAMRDLAEQIHGLQVDSSTTVIDLMVRATPSAVLIRHHSRRAHGSHQPDRVRHLRNRARDRPRDDQLPDHHRARHRLSRYPVLRRRS